MSAVTTEAPEGSHSGRGTNPHAAKGNTKGRVIVASMVGTTIEFYDFYIYATAAISVFPHLFFPKSSPTAGVLASLAIFGIAFVARPIGSIVFGHFGDRLGRKATLIGSLLTMGIATTLIGFLPTFAAIGVWAPILLAVLRFFQGVGLGGEWSGAALLSTETAEKGKRAWAAMWPQLGAPIGFLFANGFFLILTLVLHHDSTSPDLGGAFLTWGWRLPFLLSAVIVAIGLYVRFKLVETPVFEKAVSEGKKARLPLATVFRTSWKQVVLGTFVMLVTYTLFYVMTTWVLSYGIGKADPAHPVAGDAGLGMPYRDFLILQLVAVLFFGALIPVAGMLADRYGRKRTLLIVTGAIMAFGLFFTPLLRDAGTPEMLSFLIIGMVLMGLTFGPMSAALPEMFPTNVRYTGSAISYNVSSILGAAVAPFIATWLCTSYGVGWVGVYLIAMAVLTFVALALSPETKDADLTRV